MNIADLCPACRQELNETVTKKDIARGLNHLLGIFNKVCCEECRHKIMVAGKGWANKNPDKIAKAKKLRGLRRGNK